MKLRIACLVSMGLLALPLASCGGGSGTGVIPLVGLTQSDYDYVATKLNRIRTARGLPTFTVAGSLNTFAQTSAEHLAASGSPPTDPHGYFNSQNGNLGSHGFNDAAAENQGWSNDTLAPNQSHIDRIIDGMMAEETQFPPGDPRRGHFETIVNPIYVRLGTGLVKDGGDFWLANEFSD